MDGEKGRQMWGRKADRKGDSRHHAVAGPTDARFISCITFDVNCGCMLMVMTYVTRFVSV